MKRKDSLKGFALMVLMAVAFAACDTAEYDYESDRDRYERWHPNNETVASRQMAMANMLRGAWRGNTEVTYIDENGLTKRDRYDTEIQFHQSEINSIYGEGVQRDYQDGSLKYSRSFVWRIDYASSDILIEYNQTGGNTFTMRIAYRNLHLEDRSFNGLMTGTNEEDAFDYRRYGYSRTIRLVK